jgi:hypothetical protein
LAFKSAIALLFESAIFAFESAITLTAKSAIILGECDLAFENVITLVFESAIILGESIFREWRSFFVMTRGDFEQIP